MVGGKHQNKLKSYKNPQELWKEAEKYEESRVKNVNKRRP